MRRSRASLENRDAPVLALARACIDAHGPLGDARLVEMLEAPEIKGRVARASLMRIERAGYLVFDASGWRVPVDAPAVLYTPMGPQW